jgi:hypothetical protein
LLGFKSAFACQGGGVSYGGEELFLSKVEFGGSSGINADQKLGWETACDGDEGGELFFDRADGGGRACAFNNNQFSFGLKNRTEEGCVDDLFGGAAWEATFENALKS